MNPFLQEKHISSPLIFILMGIKDGKFCLVAVIWSNGWAVQIFIVCLFVCFISSLTWVTQSVINTSKSLFFHETIIVDVGFPFIDYLKYGRSHPLSDHIPATKQTFPSFIL